MSFLSDFEGRIGSVFGAAPQGYTEPFSFKKLAKRAAREMEKETYEIDGVNTAPALYTVLVSPADDSLMRPLYQQITYEVANFVTAQAQKKSYSFVGSPLVRFMVDHELKSGKFAIFAENVDAATLARLREEERSFLGGNSSVGGAAAQIRRPQEAPFADKPLSPAAPQPAPAPRPQRPTPRQQAPVQAATPAAAAGAAYPGAAVASPAPQTPVAPADELQPLGGALNDAGLSVMPAGFDDPFEQAAGNGADPFAAGSAPAGGSPYAPANSAPGVPVASASESTPMPVPVANAPLMTGAAAASAAAAASMRAAVPAAAVAGAASVPQTQRRHVPLVDMRRGVGADVAPVDVPGVAAAAAQASAQAAGSAAAQASYAAAAAAANPAAAYAADPYANPATVAAPPAAAAANALLIDRQTGQTFTATAPGCIIGRERSQAQIVLRDPNVSRRHAELSFDGRNWHIADLNSTNGTLVNDVDVSQCMLQDGDLITVGLVNLEFRGNLR